MPASRALARPRISIDAHDKAISMAHATRRFSLRDIVTAAVLKMHEDFEALYPEAFLTRYGLSSSMDARRINHEDGNGDDRRGEDEGIHYSREGGAGYRH